MQEISITKNEKVEINFVRQIVLNLIRSILTKFREEYGKLVLVNDSRRNWRKLVFSFYKANRKKKRSESYYDWNIIFSSLNLIKDELRNNFPYVFMEEDYCEADDIIAVLANRYHTSEKILIVSGDLDFIQLQKYPNVFQYSTAKRKFITEENPQKYLINKILTGDSGDGVPNFLSDDEVFVDETKRGRRVPQFRLDNLLTLPTQQDIFKTLSEDERIKYLRNRIMIDLDFIPKDLQVNILNNFHSYIIESDLSAVHKYFMEHHLKLFLINIGDFIDEI